MVKTCSTWPLLNKYALYKNSKVGLQTPQLPQTPYTCISLWERPKIENLNFVFAMVKMHSQQPKKNDITAFKKKKNGRDLQTQ